MSIFGMLGLDLSASDHTTCSRRGQHLDLPLRRAPTGAGMHLLVDSTGLSIVGFQNKAKQGIKRASATTAPHEPA